MKITKLSTPIVPVYVPVQIILETRREADVLRAIASDAGEVGDHVKAAVAGAAIYLTGKPTRDDVGAVLEALKKGLSEAGIN